MKDILIREINLSELHDFQFHLLKFYAEIEHTLHVKKIEDLVHEFYTKGIILIAKDDSKDKIIGFLCAIESFSIYANGIFGVINELYVTPDYRSQKIGRKLIHSLLKIAKENQWNRIELDTPEVEKSAKTIKFYHNEGFVEVGLRLKKTLKY